MEGEKKGQENYKQARFEKKKRHMSFGGNYFDMRRFTSLN
jgi:hypothetical protein